MIYSCMSSEATTKGIAQQLAEQHRVSTDPKWPPQITEKDRGDDQPVGAGGETAATGGQPAPSKKPDGRNRRKFVTGDVMVASARDLMLGGNFRPSMLEICQLAKVSVRTGFDHFKTVEALRLLVVEMPDVVEAIGALTLGRSPAEIARLVVTGRI